MANHYERTDRLNEEMKRAFVEILGEVKDHRMPDLISVVRVEVTRDLRYAKVYVSTLGDKAAQDDMMSALQSASGYIRRELGRRFKLHYTPEPQFVLDTSIEYGVHIAEVIRDVTPKRKAGEGEGESGDAGESTGESAGEAAPAMGEKVAEVVEAARDAKDAAAAVFEDKCE